MWRSSADLAPLGHLVEIGENAGEWFIEFDHHASRHDVDLALEWSESLAPGDWKPLARSIRVRRSKYSTVLRFWIGPEWNRKPCSWGFGWMLRERFCVGQRRDGRLARKSLTQPERVATELSRNCCKQQGDQDDDDDKPEGAGGFVVISVHHFVLVCLF